MKQTLFLIVFFLILVATGFIWYRSAPGQEGGVSPGGESEIRLTELRRLKTIQLDTSIIRDPFFGSLELPAEAAAAPEGATSAGRVNPFLPF